MTKITKSSDILKIRNSRGLNNKRGVFTPCPLNSKEEESSVNGEQVILNSELKRNHNTHEGALNLHPPIELFQDQQLFQSSLLQRLVDRHVPFFCDDENQIH